MFLLSQRASPKTFKIFQNFHWIAENYRLDFGYLLIFSGFNLKFALRNPQSNWEI